MPSRPFRSIAPTRASASALAVLAAFFLAGCRSGQDAPRDAARTLVVAAAVAPIAELGCEVAGPPCRPVAIVPPGASSHSFEPKPSLVRALQDADVYFAVGLAFEASWLPRFLSSLPRLPVVRLDRLPGLLPPPEGHGAAAPAPAHGAEEHSGGHGHEGEASSSAAGHDDHGHGGETIDPHLWTSPREMRRVADSMAAALLAAFPADSVRIRSGHARAAARLRALDSLVAARLAPLRGRSFLVNHPAWGYLARDYGLVQLSLEPGGRESGPAYLARLAGEARRLGLRAIFVQPQLGTRGAEALGRDLGIPLVRLDPYAVPADSAMRATIDSLAARL